MSAITVEGFTVDLALLEQADLLLDQNVSLISSLNYMIFPLLCSMVLGINSSLY